MHSVGEHLAKVAKAGVGAAADAFGRSALNRYYYAAYLEVRDLLGSLNSDWAGQGHSTIPDLLEGSVLKKFRAAAKEQRHAGVLSQVDVERINRRAANAASSIAATLRTAYSVRVVSDYQPEHEINFAKGTFTLLSSSEGDARAWMNNVTSQKGILLSVARELGLVT